MHNNVNDIVIEEYVVIENEIDHYDIHRDKKLKVLGDLKLISSLKVGDFISNGIIISNNTFLNKIWNYYTDYSKETINFIEETIYLAKEFTINSNYKCDDHVNCNYINKQQILTELIKSLLGIKYYQETYSNNNDSYVKLNSIISNLE